MTKGSTDIANRCALRFGGGGGGGAPRGLRRGVGGGPLERAAAAVAARGTGGFVENVVVIDLTAVVLLKC